MVMALAGLGGCRSAPSAAGRSTSIASARADDRVQPPDDSQERARTGETLQTPPASLPPTTEQMGPAP
jgi:hypothetical protein